MTFCVLVNTVLLMKHSDANLFYFIFYYLIGASNPTEQIILSQLVEKFRSFEAAMLSVIDNDDEKVQWACSRSCPKKQNIEVKDHVTLLKHLW